MAPPTGDLQRRVAADGAGAGVRVGCVAVVRPDIRFAVLAVDDSQEEQLTGRQQHPVRHRILVRRRHRKSVAMPRDHRRRISFRLAVERRRLAPGHVLALRVFHYSRVTEHARPCNRKRNRKFKKT